VNPSDWTKGSKSGQRGATERASSVFFDIPVFSAWIIGNLARQRGVGRDHRLIKHQPDASLAFRLQGFATVAAGAAY
jgi:hypothetical protein